MLQLLIAAAIRAKKLMHTGYLEKVFVAHKRLRALTIGSTTKLLMVVPACVRAKNKTSKYGNLTSADRLLSSLCICQSVNMKTTSVCSFGTSRLLGSGLRVFKSTPARID